MTLRLVIEHAPHPQRSVERRHEGGDLSIGRGAECDWQLDDPDMFISRKHCVISGRDGQFTVTDSSRGGLFLDGRDKPLGPGVAATLENGMRLRLGDLVIRAELLSVDVQAAPARAAPLPAGFDADDFFAPRPPATPAPARPDSLPQPFEGGQTPFATPTPTHRAPPPLFDDPFTLDPVATPAPQHEPAPGSSFSDFSFGFDDPTPTPASISDPQPPLEKVMKDVAPVETAQPVVPVVPEAIIAPSQTPPQASDAALVAAFFRGLGVDATVLPDGGSAEEMEALGRRFRLLAEGLVHLLRTRAREKNSLRVAQTIIGSADVNPLKFLVTTEDALGALVAPRGKGYLGPEDAINAAFRDLSDHQLRTWTALQASLRRMIDRFDPAAFEAEVEKIGLVKSLIAGSRSARLWQLYEERYRDIAKSAEDRFLGDIGADFREAYEAKKENGK
jgi:type VI secretion system protein ImpI